MKNKPLKANKLKEEIRRKTGELEELVGNMELNLLSTVLRERNELLNILPAVCDNRHDMVDFLEGILERDMMMRARIGIEYRSTGEKIRNLRSEKKVAVKYSIFMN